MANVVICDDDPDRVVEWADRIREALGDLILDVRPLSPDAFAGAFRALKDRKTAASRDEMVQSSDDASVLDEASILVVDFDLTPTGKTQGTGLAHEVLSGEFGDTFAYLARCYSRADYTLLVNQLSRQRTFDLTLTAQLKSVANLAISEEELDSAELWTGSGDAYKPSHWPRLIAASGRVGRLAALLDLDAPILPALGLDALLEQDAFAPEHLDALGDDPSDTTFRTFASSSDQFGLVGRNDRQNDDGILARIAASGVCRWLDHVVMPSQSALVDAPHLVARFPVHLEDDWTLATDLERENELLAGPLAPFAAAKLPLDDWIGRAVWSWPDATLVPMAPAETESLAMVFAEDVSRFVPIDEAYEFNAAVAGPYKQRFIRRVQGVEYLPRNRLYT